MQGGSTAEGVHLLLSQSAKFFVNLWRCAPGTPRGQKLEMSAMKFRPPTLTGMQQWGCQVCIETCKQMRPSVSIQENTDACRNWMFV